MLGFAGALAVGTLLLWLPVSAAPGERTSFVDPLFTATSALCVTGLTTLDTATHWSGFGLVVILLLIQLGGLGIMVFAMLVGLALARKLSVRARMTAAAETKSDGAPDVRRIVRGIKVTTFAVLLFILWTELRGGTAVNIFGKRLARGMHRQAISVVLLAIAAITGVTLWILATTDFGLDRFGTAVALELMAAGTEMLGIDADPDRVQDLNGRLTQVVRADATKEDALRQLAVDEFDRAVIAITGDLKASNLTASLLLQLNGPVIWAKATDAQHGRILEQLGVHHVVYPKTDMGRRVAHLVRGAAKDYLEIDEGYALVKASAPRELHGRPLGETGLRERRGVTIAARRGATGGWEHADYATVLGPDDTVLAVGPTRKVEAFAQLP